MQVDGVEEELPDELENACSDDSKMLKYTHTRTSTHQLILLRLPLPSCQFALTPDISCPLLSPDDSDCSSSSTASIAAQSG